MALCKGIATAAACRATTAMKYNVRREALPWVLMTLVVSIGALVLVNSLHPGSAGWRIANTMVRNLSAFGVVTSLGLLILLTLDRRQR